jgi:hypothetical protein
MPPQPRAALRSAPMIYQRLQRGLRMAVLWRGITLAVSLVLLVLPTSGVAHAGPSASGDWRQARFDAARSGNNSAETTLSPFHARHLRRIWSFHTPASVWGPPAVVGHRIFLASQSEHETGAVQALARGRRFDRRVRPGTPLVRASHSA